MTAAVLQFVLTPVATATPGYPSLPATAPDAIFSFGKDRSLDVIFGPDGAGGPCQLRGPVGEKVVVVGECFYLDRKKGGMRFGGYEEAPKPDNRWNFWYRQLFEAMSKSWEGNTAGEAQVLLQVTPDQRISILKELGFTPGLNEQGHFDVSDETHRTFMAGVRKCLDNVSGPKIPAFPSEADPEDLRSATFVATFQADRNLYVAVPDLIVFNDLPTEEKSLWTARICTVLDAGYLYTESDVLRKRLPDAFHQRFIPAHDYPHSVEPTNYGPGCGGIWSNWYTTEHIDPKASDALVKYLEYYLDSGRFTEAQGFARSVVQDHASLSDTLFNSLPVVRALRIDKITLRDVEHIKSTVEKAAAKGYFDFDWNSKDVPRDACGQCLLRAVGDHVWK